MKETSSWVSVAFLVLMSSLVYHGDASSSGAPDSPQPCDFLLPSHGLEGQTSPSPFEIVPENLTYQGNQTIRVHLRSIEADVKFKGFLIQARYANPLGGLESTKIGDFLPDTGTRLTCANNGGGSLTHSDSSEKDSIVVLWQAPRQPVGDIRFRATFVEQRDTFWVDVKSDVVGDPDATTGPVPSSSSSTAAVTLPPVDPVDLSSCGSDKSCFRHPPQCSLSSPSDNRCEYAITWSDVGNSVGFELISSVTEANQWVAVGLSHDTKMGDDSVMDCIHDAGTSQIVVQPSWNEVGWNIPLSNTSLGILPGSSEGSLQNGFLICRYSRLKHLSTSLHEEGRVFPLDRPYYILLARGPAANGFKSAHRTQPVVSAQQVELHGTLFINIGGSLKYPLIKAHGILMIFAWMVFASFAILMPRYMKHTWPGKLLRGKAIWFQIHQPAMLMAFLLTITAFIIIFVEAKGYSKLTGVTSAHPPMGILVTALVIINPVMSVFRCGPDHPRRKIFNFCHFLVGTLAHILSAATIFIGLYMSKAQLPEWSRWVMCGYLGWHAAVEIILAVHMYSRQAGAVDELEMNGTFTLTDKKQKNVPSAHISNGEAKFVDIQEKRVDSGFATVVLAVHLLGVLAFAITLSVLIGRV